MDDPSNSPPARRQAQSIDSGPVNHDDMAEMALLGAMLISPRAVAAAVAHLNPVDFYRPHHAAIWAAIVDSDGWGDVVIVQAELTRRGERLNTVGGHTYLYELIRACPLPGPDHISHYAKIIHAAADVRRRDVTAMRLSQAIDDPDIWNRLIADAATGLNGGPPLTGGLVTTDGATFLLDTSPTPTAIWGEDQQVLWADGEALMLCGPSGVGKTTLAAQLVAARLGLISEVLGVAVQATSGRILYLACDRPAQIARNLARSMRPEWRDVLRERLSVWKGPPPDDFAKAPGTLLDMARQSRADTVIIDSLKDVAIPLSDDAVGAGYNKARQTAIAAGIQLLELHHQVKRGNLGKPPTTLADVYGSVWLTAGAGSVILVWGEPGDPLIRVNHLKQPAEEWGPLDISHDHRRGVSVVHHQADLLTHAVYAPAGLTVADAANVLFDTKTPTPAQREKARRKLEQHVAQGLMIRTKGRLGGSGGTSPDVYFATSNEEEPRRW